MEASVYFFSFVHIFEFSNTVFFIDNIDFWIIFHPGLDAVLFEGFPPLLCYHLSGGATKAERKLFTSGSKSLMGWRGGIKDVEQEQRGQKDNV